MKRLRQEPTNAVSATSADSSCDKNAKIALAPQITGFPPHLRIHPGDCRRGPRPALTVGKRRTGKPHSLERFPRN
jgi:hypothetical protein